MRARLRGVCSERVARERRRGSPWWWRQRRNGWHLMLQRFERTLKITLLLSTLVAAVALPMPKLTIVISPAVALAIGLSLPTTGTRCHWAKSFT